jgi:hypothetical protein
MPFDRLGVDRTDPSTGAATTPGDNGAACCRLLLARCVYGVRAVGVAANGACLMQTSTRVKSLAGARASLSHRARHEARCVRRLRRRPRESSPGIPGETRLPADWSAACFFGDASGPGECVPAGARPAPLLSPTSAVAMHEVDHPVFQSSFTPQARQIMLDDDAHAWSMVTGILFAIVVGGLVLGITAVLLSI